MKCPFLVRRKDVFDKEGKKIGEDIEILECIKNECMVYDSAIKLCSLLSSNMKTGIFIEDFKNGVKELKEEMFQRAEAIGIVVSTTVQTMQDALLGRFDILKKQNEVVALGFDRLIESENAVNQAIRETSEKTASQIGELQDILKDADGNMKSSLGSIQEAMGKISQDQAFLSMELKNLFDEYSRIFAKLGGDLTGRIDQFTDRFEKFSAASQAGIETVNGGIDRVLSSSQDVYKKIDMLESLVAGIDSVINVVKTESESVRTLAAKIDDIGEVLKHELAGVKSENLAAVIELKENSLRLLGDIKSEVGSGRAQSQESIDQFKAEVAKLNETIRTEIGIFGADTKDIINSMQDNYQRLADLGHQIDAGLKSTNGSLADINKGLSESLLRIGELTQGLRQGVEEMGTGFVNKLGEIAQSVRTEITAVKDSTATPMAGIKEGLTRLESLFDTSSSSLGNMSAMMSSLNQNYLESLSKIAGLTEGMRKGVEKVGESMHDSARDLVGEIKKEIGALEKQYEATFMDIARLGDIFSELNNRLEKMTHSMEKEFRESFDRQSQLSEFTRDILVNIKSYFEKDDARYQEEQVMKKKKDGLDHFDRATLYFYRGNHDLALSEIERALETDRTAEYLNLQGLILTELGRRDDAKKSFQEALKLEPDMSEIHNNLGVLYLKMKKLDNAAAAFEDAIKRNVNYALAYVHLGKTLLELEKYDEAMKSFDHALQIDPGNREAREAIAAYREGKVD